MAWVGLGFESAIERAKKGLGEAGSQREAEGGIESAQVISWGVSQRQVEAVVGEEQDEDAGHKASWAD